MKTPAITFDRAHSIICYDPETGVFTWRVKQGTMAPKGGVIGSIQHGYRKCTVDREQIKLHRLAWFMTHGVWPSGQIDHIDGDKLNNRIANLRDVSMSVNMQNRYSVKRKDNDMPYGVTLNPKGRFVANIRVGVFDTAKEAEEAYMTAKRLIHVGCTR